MNLNNGGKCNHSAISCSVPGSTSVPFPGSPPSAATTPRLFFTPLPPNPPPIPLPDNTSNITIMELAIPVEARVAAERPRVQLDATIGTEVILDPFEDSSINVNAITYQLFRNNTLLTDTLVSGRYQAGLGFNNLYTFNSTFTWVDHPTDPIHPTDPVLPGAPVLYQVVANIGTLGGVLSAQVRNRGFTGVLHPGDPV